MALHDNCYWSSFLQLFSGIQYAAENCFWREPVLNNWSIIVFPWQMSELFGGLEDRNLSARRFIGIRFVSHSQPLSQSSWRHQKCSPEPRERESEWEEARARARHALSNIQPRHEFWFRSRLARVRIPGEINFASRCQQRGSFVREL